jgi:hypothetical protein
MVHISLLLLRKYRRRPQRRGARFCPAPAPDILPLPCSWSRNLRNPPSPPHHHRTIHRRPAIIDPRPCACPCPRHPPPRALPSATAPTRCASCPRPHQPPRASMPAPAPVPAMPAATAPLPPTRSAVSRCEFGARYPWKARRDGTSTLDPRSTWKVRQIGGSGSWQSARRRPPRRPARCRPSTAATTMGSWAGPTATASRPPPSPPSSRPPSRGYVIVCLTFPHHHPCSSDAGT